MVGAATRVTQEFDPSSVSGKRWLEKMANKMKATGTTCQHISNNAPRDLCDPDVEKRKAGVAVAKKWLERAAMLGAKSRGVKRRGARTAHPRLTSPHSTNTAAARENNANRLNE